MGLQSFRGRSGVNSAQEFRVDHGPASMLVGPRCIPSTYACYQVTSSQNWMLCVAGGPAALPDPAVPPVTRSRTSLTRAAFALSGP